MRRGVLNQVLRRSSLSTLWVVALISGLSPCPASAGPDDASPGLRFREDFDDERLVERGWYDGKKFAIIRAGALNGGSLMYHWKEGTTTPDSSSGVRRLFDPSETIYLRAYLRLSPDWKWSGQPYHPHLMHFLTTENEPYRGPSETHLTVYIEANEGKLRLAAQDIQNKDAPHGLTQGPLRGGYNGTFHDSEGVLFNDDKWHCVEAQFTLNSLDLERGTPRADGVARAWFDGRLVVDKTDLILRSTDFPNMKFNQFLLTPYFGPGLLPGEQSLWVDELAVGTERLGLIDRKSSPDATKAVKELRPRTVRMAAAQPKNRTIDFRLAAAEVLERVDQSLSELEGLVRKAGEARCDVLAFPEDTLGLLNWEVAHPDSLSDVLPEAVRRMLDRLGRAAANHQMYLVVCSDARGPDDRVYNTSFLLGRDGKEIGRYLKVNLPLAEQSRARGREFPVFPTPDIGAVGMLICYDMVFPEAARCLALQGADVIFHPTLGGAAIGDDDISLAAFRTRAVENFVYLVVSQRGGGSMIISPQGKIIATSKEQDGLAIAEIDTSGGREGGDAFNTQRDMRGRLFRERVPSAYGVLTDPSPPILAKVPSNVSPEEAIRIMATALTTGEARYNEAVALARSGQTKEAIELFERLCEECRTSWIDRASRARLRELKGPEKPKAPVLP